MTPLEQIATEILANRPIEVRALVQDYVRRGAMLEQEPAPGSQDPRVRAVAAGLAELFASRMAQRAPAWALEVGKLPAPLYLIEAAHRSPRLRARIERESPEPLRKRNVYAPPAYLEAV